MLTAGADVCCASLRALSSGPSASAHLFARCRRPPWTTGVLREADPGEVTVRRPSPPVDNRLIHSTPGRRGGIHSVLGGAQAAQSTAPGWTALSIPAPTAAWPTRRASRWQRWRSAGQDRPSSAATAGPASARPPSSP